MIELSITYKLIEVLKNCLIYMGETHNHSTWKSCSTEVIDSVKVSVPVDHASLDKFINEVQKLCFEFVWDRKQDKIKQSSASRNVSNGGINIPDIKTYIKALKLTWLRKLYQNKANLRKFCRQYALK